MTEYLAPLSGMGVIFICLWPVFASMFVLLVVIALFIPRFYFAHRASATRRSPHLYA